MAAPSSSLRRAARGCSGGDERGGRGEGRGRRGGGGRGGRRGVEGRRGEVGEGLGGRASKAQLSFVKAPSRLAAAPSGPRRLGRTAPPPRPVVAPLHGRIGSPPSWVTSQFPGGLGGDRPLGGTGQCGSRIQHRAVASVRAIPSGRFLPLQFLVGNNSGINSGNNNDIHRLPGARNSKTASVIRAAVGCEAPETSTSETSPPVTCGESPCVRSPRVAPDFQPRSSSFERNAGSGRCRSSESGQRKTWENAHCNNGLTKVQLTSLTAIHGTFSENDHVINSKNSHCKDVLNVHSRDSANGHVLLSDQSHLRNSQNSPCTNLENGRPRGLETGASQSGHRNHGERASGACDTRADDSGLRVLLDLSAPSVLTPDYSHHLPADNPAAIDVGRSPSGATQRWGGRGEGKTARGTTLPLRRLLLLLDDPEDDSSPPAGGPVLTEDTPEEMRVRSGVALRRRRRGWAAGGCVPRAPPIRDLGTSLQVEEAGAGQYVPGFPISRYLHGEQSMIGK
ncbi:uncharacterized protein LOC116940084 isoform X1 [Petromyzon marinus]|uniref:uncharacterized protein LOC116940084 isoform X1 n=1 Tax=Petromyzon marinus TaxID=7757 RepID=UPI003F7228EB